MSVRNRGSRLSSSWIALGGGFGLLVGIAAHFGLADDATQAPEASPAATPSPSAAVSSSPTPTPTSTSSPFEGLSWTVGEPTGADRGPDYPASVPITAEILAEVAPLWRIEVVGEANWGQVVGRPTVVYLTSPEGDRYEVVEIPAPYASGLSIAEWDPASGLALLDDDPYVTAQNGLDPHFILIDLTRSAWTVLPGPAPVNTYRLGTASDGVSYFLAGGYDWSTHIHDEHQGVASWDFERGWTWVREDLDISSSSFSEFVDGGDWMLYSSGEGYPLTNFVAFNLISGETVSIEIPTGDQCRLGEWPVQETQLLYCESEDGGSYTLAAPAFDTPIETEGMTAISEGIALNERYQIPGTPLVLSGDGMYGLITEVGVLTTAGYHQIAVYDTSAGTSPIGMGFTIEEPAPGLYILNNRSYDPVVIDVVTGQVLSNSRTWALYGNALVWVPWDEPTS